MVKHNLLAPATADLTLLLLGKSIGSLRLETLPAEVGVCADPALRSGLLLCFGLLESSTGVADAGRGVCLGVGEGKLDAVVSVLDIIVKQNCLSC